MEKTPLRWIRAQVQTGQVDLADVTMLCDRVEELEKENAGLREENDELTLISTPSEGEYTVFLNKEDQQRLATLYEKDELAYEQEADPGMEFDEAFTYFVSGAIDMAWDMATFDPNKVLRREAIAKHAAPPKRKTSETRRERKRRKSK